MAALRSFPGGRAASHPREAAVECPYENCHHNHPELESELERVMNTTGQVTVRQWFALPNAERARRAAAFREADGALQDNGDREKAAGIDWETDEYLELNGIVNDLWPTVPWWCREPALPHPGSRRGAALRALAAVAALAAAVLIALSLSGCHVGWPCDNHGGAKWTNTKIYECNDGTWE